MTNFMRRRFFSRQVFYLMTGLELALLNVRAQLQLKNYYFEGDCKKSKDAAEAVAFEVRHFLQS